MDPLENSPASSVAGSMSSLHCAGCGAPIMDRFYLKALDKIWHEDCLKCACCDCRLGEVGSTCFTKANLILCRRDYLRLFGNIGYCSSCNKPIPAFELVMRANGNVYHLECFNCHNCSYRFCVGDRFYLWNNRILCEGDYEDRVISGLTNPTSTTSGHPVLRPNDHLSSLNGNSPASVPVRSCIQHPVIVPNNNHHLTCIVNEPAEMNRNDTGQFAD